MKKLILIILLLLITPLISADSQQYLTKGISRSNSYQQDGVGVWNTEGARYTRTGTFKPITPPLIEDIDNDDINEIIIIENNFLTIYNYTTGIGIIEESSYNLQQQNYTSFEYYQTPGLIDYDSDNITEIIVFNTTHMLTLKHNGTTIILNQSTLTGITQGTGLIAAQYPVVKCAPANTWATNNVTCTLPVINRTVTNKLSFITYDLDSNIVSMIEIVSMANSDVTPANTHLIDIDADGFNEILYRLYDSANNDIFIYMGELSSTGVITSSLLKSHLLGASSQFTDIIINNLDGNAGDGLEVTWGFTSDGTNWDGYTIDSNGADISSSYCTALTCPEGESASFNMFETNAKYSTFTNDVCYYIRNNNNNDPGINTDTIFCLSQQAGENTIENTLHNTQNFSNFFHVHENDIKGTEIGLITPLFVIVNNIKQNSTPTLNGNDQFIIPIDYQQIGSIDLIGTNTSRMIYYDDAYTNANVNIDSLDFDTANPVCRGEIVTFTLDLTDEENNNGFCHIQETYSNGTEKSLQSNTSFTTPNSITLNYNADEDDTFPLVFRCRDQFHDNYVTQTYTITVINDTTACNFKGEGGGTINYVVDEDAQADENFVNNWNEVLSDVGVQGGVMKGIIWIIVIMVVLGSVAFAASKSPNNMSPQGLTILLVMFLTSMLILGWYFNMIGAVPLIMFGLVLVTVIGFKAFKATGSTGGE